MGYRQVRHDLHYRRALRPRALKEGASCGHVVEEPVDQYGRPLRVGGGRDLRRLPALDDDLGGRAFARGVVREKEETLAIEGSASPLNPRVVTASISSTFRILLVACLSTERLASSLDIPEPSSRTRMREVPPSPSSTSMREAPASRAFSTSSLTTEAGRSTTSPAATCWATLGSRTLILARGVFMYLGALYIRGRVFPRAGV